MTGKLLSSVAFLTTIFALQNAQSAEIPQALTIDRLSAETADFLDSLEISSPYELKKAKAGETDVSVNIGGTIYYFTPKDADQQNILQNLANIGSSALVKLDSADGAIYTLGGKYYGYDAQKLPKSGYSLTEVPSKTVRDLIITKYTLNDNNKLNEKYYRVDVKQPESGRKVYDTRQASLRGDIDADFIGSSYVSSSSSVQGGAVYNPSKSTIGSVIGNFINNYVQSTLNGEDDDCSAYGGAIYNSSNSTIGNITSNFIGNYAKSNYDWALGGAIYNGYKSTIGDITGDFISNYAQSASYEDYDQVYGGAIYNSGTINNITGDLINNYAQGSSDAVAYGGAISNSGKIGNITGDLINNYAKAYNESAYGGAVYNTGTISNITGNFIDNYTNTQRSNSTYGGAVYNTGTISNITGDFINNYAQGTYYTGHGGAIYNDRTSLIGNITGSFIANYAQGRRAWGGAISNSSKSTINNITGNFINNSAQGSYGTFVYGGAIANSGTIGKITGDFINNYTNNQGGAGTSGGAIYNTGTIGNIINSNFIGNYVKGNKDSQGGAIWSDSDILITADNGTSLFSGNSGYVKSNAIYMSGKTTALRSLNLSAVNKGTITFDDGIDGVNYNIKVNGDGSGVVVFNNLVENVSNFTLSDNSVVHLGLNADIQALNMSVAAGSQIVGQNSLSSPIITVDVEVDKADNTVNSGAIHIANDISGDYRVLVNALNSDVLDNTEDAVVPFLFAPNDKEDTSSSFSVARVIGSPYLWTGDVNAKGEETGSVWYLNLTDEANPDYKTEDPDDPENPEKPDVKPSKPVVRPIAPEVIAGEGLHEAAIEQTRSVVRNVRNKVASGREYCPNCGIYSAEWNGQKLRNVWVLAQGETATIDKPVKMDADIWGVEAGFDVQNDVNNTLGVFASYRKGEYDLSGKADKIRSNIGSEIDIDSYLAGLYYRYDKNMNWLFATVYGGVQQADAKTGDGIAKFDTDGIEFGASVEAGHTFALSNDLTLDPSLGLYYTQINFDNAKDNVGKEYSWKDIKHLEAELGAKLEKQIDAAKVYVKPSVIQTVTSGDSVKITGLNKLSTYDDQTLGRIELGGRYGFTDALSAYGWVNYTFGSDYDATAFGVGVNYAW